MNNYLNEWKKRNTWWRVFRNFPLIFPSHSSAEQHDDVSWSRLHASPAEQHAAQSSGHQHRQHPQRQCESQQQCKKRKTICVVFYDAYTNWISVCVCFPDVSVLHERAALSRVPVSYLSLPADTPAGVFTNPNWTTGTKLWTSNQETLWEVPHRRLIGPTIVVLPQGQSLKVHYVEILDSDIKK